jgi:dihydrolipoamide dehydrogenase
MTSTTATDSISDWIIIGGGPAGYVAAIRAAQLGQKVVLVDKEPHLGGTCLNVGCIPSKALLNSTEHYRFLLDQASAHGIEADNVRVNLGTMQERRRKVIETMRGGVRQLVAGRGIDILQGHASILGAGKVRVSGKDGTRDLLAHRILIATGSRPIALPFLPFDGKRVLSSTEALELEKVPSSMIVIGAGAIGLELGSVWNRLGTKVTVVEFLPRIGGNADADVSKTAERLFVRQGIHILTDTRVLEGKVTRDGVTIKAIRNGIEMLLDAECVLVAVGRRPETESSGIQTCGIALDAKGRIEVDTHFQTSVPGIHAIGDVIAGPMLAHKAEEDAVALMEHVHTGYGHVDYDLIPGVIYTDPEIASVGLTEEAARAQYPSIRVGKFNVAGNGRAIASDHAHGMVKIIADAVTDRILGVHIVAHQASELIASAVAHMQYGASSEDLARTVHAHPTLSESIKEAALAVDGRALHAVSPGLPPRVPGLPT